MKPALYLAALCGLFLAVTSKTASASQKPSAAPGAIFATDASNGARVIIKRSPILGDNVSITVKIDGIAAGALVRGRTFDRYVVPGHHVMVASPNRLGYPWRETLDLHAGETHVFVAKYNVDRLYLQRLRTTR